MPWLVGWLPGWFLFRFFVSSLLPLLLLSLSPSPSLPYQQYQNKVLNHFLLLYTSCTGTVCMRMLKKPTALNKAHTGSQISPREQPVTVQVAMGVSVAAILAAASSAVSDKTP